MKYIFSIIFLLLLGSCTNPDMDDVDQNTPSGITEQSNTEVEQSGGEVTNTLDIITTLSDYREFLDIQVSTSEVLTGLDAPWAMTWLSDTEILITERFGTLVRYNVKAEQRSEISGIPDVFSSGQGGLLDIAIHPNFEENNFLYFSYAFGTSESNRLTVARGELNGDSIENIQTIFETAQLKSGSSHFGSRFAWLADGTLTFSVGDGGNPPISYNGELIREQAQNLNAHLGKIIRINDDGTIPEDNPFVGRPDALPEIYSYGHRNSQGLFYSKLRDILVASEHGSKGGDELNIIESGENYGWPLATYSTEYDASSTRISENTTLKGTISPLVAWTPTIAPSELIVYEGDQYPEYLGDIFVSAMLLRESSSIIAYRNSPAGALIHVDLNEAGEVMNQRLVDLGEVRVRSVSEGPDEYIYVLTDATGPQNREGRNGGSILRIESFKE